MSFLSAIDVQLFRWINQGLTNPFFDWLMPILSGYPLFNAVVAILVVALLVKGGARGRIFVVTIFLSLMVADSVLSHSIKDLVGRPRPFLTLPDVRLLVGKGGSFSMPSSHAANWFAALMVTFVFYRKAVWLVAPLAFGVSFSRVYNGVHYPSDVFVGAILGAGAGAAVMWMMQITWNTAGRHLWPLWWEKLPVLSQASSGREKPRSQQTLTSEEEARLDRHWLNLGYAFILVVLAARWIYLAGGSIDLSEDEAYQWLWSKHPALSYYSKPPFIAYAQLLGTSLWGDTVFGVRFLSPLITAGLSLILLRFMAQLVSARLGLCLILAATATPLFAVGGILMTIDPLSVLFWTAAMISGWRAVREDSTRWWLWTGLWMGLGFLSKYTSLFQWLCWAVYFAVSPAGRRQLRRPGLYFALGINVLLATPVLLWNAQHEWITVFHVASDGGLQKEFQPTLRYIREFIPIEIFLLNPVFSLATVWAAVAFWRQKPRDERLVYLFCMGAPELISYTLLSIHSRVLPNWIVPAVVPLFACAAIYWDKKWRGGFRPARIGLLAGLFIGALGVFLMHHPTMVTKVTHFEIPPRYNPLRRVQGWPETAHMVGEARKHLLQEGKPVFIVGDHYGITSQITFYLPEAKACATKTPLVYYRTSTHPENQFFFWPGYKDRKGQNAIYVSITEEPGPAPDRLVREFASVTDLGIHEVLYKGNVWRRLQLFECRDLQ
jgi:membrane-associated phospholipid phosphatase